MEIYNFENDRRLKCEVRNYDLVVAGGGISGVCCAITAAREGLSVALIQDRPVLGGNASSEVRLWVLGATSHMGNNNRWAREGGVINELLVENTYRNKEGNPVLFDMVLMDKVLSEENISLFLNTIIHDVKKDISASIRSIIAFNASSETSYEFNAPLFVDCTGDGIVSYLAGVPFRMGAEDREEYNEAFVPDKEKYGELLGHSIFFYMKDTGKPVHYVAPAFALKDVEKKIPKIFKSEYFNTGHHGCKYWWLEYGGRIDTIHDTETIKYELWKIVYGIWDYVKNSGKFPEMENYTLEWVGLIPGKRESRRMKGLYTLTQQDIIEQRIQKDAVAFGGWAVDLHCADAVYSPMRGCDQYHSKGIYSIPYRCYLPESIDNLFIAGRLISVSHVAFASTRVMATCGHGAQAVGMAAALCRNRGILPKDLLEEKNIAILQEKLNIAGQSIPLLPINGDGNLALQAAISTSSFLNLSELSFDGEWLPLDFSSAQMLPVEAGKKYCFEVELDVEEKTTLVTELRCSSKPTNYTPDVIVEKMEIALEPGVQRVNLSFSKGVSGDQYGFLIFLKNSAVKIKTSRSRISGILSVFNKFNIAVNNYGRQEPPEGCGLESFEFWCPDRRPKGENLAMKISPSLEIGNVNELRNGSIRPIARPNAWIADMADSSPWIELNWEKPQNIKEIKLYFDTDYDHPMESVQMGHAENVMPFCVRDFKIECNGQTIVDCKNNYETIRTFILKEEVITDFLRIHMVNPSSVTPASVFYIYVC
ncbi:MAG: FAD-dependent oxidoreductase [Tannerella sp.]|jgi:hypothetical protein|nr:FAD-dependent oxidoreductase [Tannerella sp.]